MARIRRTTQQTEEAAAARLERQTEDQADQDSSSTSASMGDWLVYALFLVLAALGAVWIWRRNEAAWKLQLARMRQEVREPSQREAAGLVPTVAQEDIPAHLYARPGISGLPDVVKVPVALAGVMLEHARAEMPALFSHGPAFDAMDPAAWHELTCYN